MSYQEPVEQKLRYIYEDLIWLGSRSHNTPRQARAWYSQVLATTMASKVRIFTGKVSQSALSDLEQKLVLEHYARLSFELSQLVETHVKNKTNAPEEFLALIERCERVHITTDAENHKAKQAKGDYASAGIVLVDWSEIGSEAQDFLWAKKLKGKVCNAKDYAPKTTP